MTEVVAVPGQSLDGHLRMSSSEDDSNQVETDENVVHEAQEEDGDNQLTQVPESPSPPPPVDEQDQRDQQESHENVGTSSDLEPVVRQVAAEQPDQQDAEASTLSRQQNSSSEASAEVTESPPEERQAEANETPSSETSESKKRKAADDDSEENEAAKKAKSDVDEKLDQDDDEDDGTCCPICFEPWTNSGEHRIASLKCGHFFGRSCIERWLRSSGDDCPNCNEKAHKRDVRLHYVARLKAVDTAEKDRAVGDLEKVKCQLRTLELEHTTAKVTNAMQREEIDKLRRQLRQICPDPNRLALLEDCSQPSTSGLGAAAGGASSSFTKLHYVKRLDLIKADPDHRERYCRIMAYNETHGMLAVSQPSFTALAPGYGVRRLNILDLRVEKFICLHKEPIRDLAFNPVCQDQLLSVSQDKSARLTNISSCGEIQRYMLSAEAWSCCWHLDQPTAFFVGTKRSQILMFDTRDASTSEPRTILEFPVTERRPIIALAYVAAAPKHKTFPCGGLLVQTLGSLWFFENRGESFYAHKLEVEGLFWSLRFDAKTRLILASTKPTPHARHVVCEPVRINVSQDPLKPDFKVTAANVLLDNRRGGSYTDRSFLRPAVFEKPGGGSPDSSSTLLISYGRGSVQSDHKLILQEVGTDKFIQEVPVPKPILDICPITLNHNHYVVLLCETEVFIYKWT